MKDNDFEMLTVEQAAKAVGIGRTKMFHLLRDGEGPPIIKIGALTRIRRGALNLWLLEREVGTQAPSTWDEVRHQLRQRRLAALTQDEGPTEPPANSRDAG